MFRPVLIAFMVLLFGTQATFAERYEAGKHYEVLPSPVVTRDKSKIEVVELFWYGCSHCFNFEPMLQNWKKTLGDDVDFHQMPAMWNATMKLHAQAFYTAKALDVLDEIHMPIFNAIHVDKNRLASRSSLERFFARHGVDEATFNNTFTSFGVTSQLRLAESRASSYRMQGTPELVVNGRYRIAGALAGGHSEMLKVAEFLIEKERARLAE